MVDKSGKPAQNVPSAGFRSATERMATMTATTASTASTASDAPPPDTCCGQRGAPGAATGAAERAVSRHSVTFDVFGTRVELLPPEQLAFLAGVGVLAALEIVEWPVALVLAIGHQLAHSHHGRVLREFGEALEEA